MAEKKEPDDKRAIAVELQGRLMTGIAVLTGLTLLIGLGVVFGPGASRALQEMAAANPDRPVAASEPAASPQPRKSVPLVPVPTDRAAQSAETETAKADETKDAAEPAEPGAAPEYRTILYDARLRPAI
ncbi:hypothetical protein [Afifella sp. IM 167]|uniref:hypothetical protein n=1 Tax=Afifella sp. IM 167 TaxID=2033586 RepID=UPI001CCC0627|nr:hypothetical protein [Afifella sp. IM 167]MBZ8133492.1 hypothetical protein [Afifella sp. IM 167]